MARKTLPKQSRVSRTTVKSRNQQSKLGKRAKLRNLYRAKIGQARYLLGLLGSLIVADGIISNYIVKSELGSEGNPYIQSIVGQTSFVFIKIIAALIGTIILWRVFKRHTRLGLASIIFYVLLYTAILWWNLTIWFVGQHNIPILTG